MTVQVNDWAVVTFPRSYSSSFRHSSLGGSTNSMNFPSHQLTVIWQSSDTIRCGTYTNTLCQKHTAYSPVAGTQSWLLASPVIAPSTVQWISEPDNHLNTPHHFIITRWCSGSLCEVNSGRVFDKYQLIVFPIIAISIYYHLNLFCFLLLYLVLRKRGIVKVTHPWMNDMSLLPGK
jgi:hypothetical protein